MSKNRKKFKEEKSRQTSMEQGIKHHYLNLITSRFSKSFNVSRKQNLLRDYKT